MPSQVSSAAAGVPSGRQSRCRPRRSMPHCPLRTRPAGSSLLPPHSLHQLRHCSYYLRRHSCHQQPLAFPSGRRSRCLRYRSRPHCLRHTPRAGSSLYPPHRLHQLLRCSYHLSPLQTVISKPVGVPVWQAVSVPATQVEAALPAAHAPAGSSLNPPRKPSSAAPSQLSSTPLQSVIC